MRGFKSFNLLTSLRGARDTEARVLDRNLEYFRISLSDLLTNRGLRRIFGPSFNRGGWGQGCL